MDQVTLPQPSSHVTFIDRDISVSSFVLPCCLLFPALQFLFSPTLLAVPLLTCGWLFTLIKVTDKKGRWGTEGPTNESLLNWNRTSVTWTSAVSLERSKRRDCNYVGNFNMHGSEGVEESDLFTSSHSHSFIPLIPSLVFFIPLLWLRKARERMKERESVTSQLEGHSSIW